jgi:protein disulfide-isomerase A1
MPTYEQLGDLYSSAAFSSKVTVAKIDATANDVPEKIQGFPTIKLYPAGSKDSPVDYSGSRSLDDLANFIRDNGKHGIDGLAAANDTEDEVMTDAEDTMIKAAPAATKSATEGVAEAVLSAASEAAQAVKTFVADSDEGMADSHDEL